MKRLLVTVMCLSATVCAGQSVVSKSFEVDLGETERRSFPVTLQVAGEVPDADLVAVHSVSRAMFPASVHDGEVTVVLSGLLSPGTHTFELQKVQRRRSGVVRVEEHKDSTLKVHVARNELTTYHYGDDLRKPFLWPVLSEGEVPITRAFPMDEADRSKDHPHHVSFWTGFGDINGADWWEYGERTGWQATKSLAFGSGAAYGWIETAIEWQDAERKPVLDEQRSYRFYHTSEDERLVDLTIAFTANHGDAQFGDTKEGGFAGFRMADALRERGGSGLITNSEGGAGAGETWGKPAAWCDYSGVIKGEGPRGLAVFDHPSSFRHPTHWHVRDYGLMGTNAFGYSYFYDGEKNGEHLLKAGETMTFQYRIYVHSGDVESSDVAGHYGDFAAPPVARWVE